jgi:tripartite-type tricarboxylate transporter receptor subunit TctC
MRAFLAALLVLVCGASVVSAQTFPSKPITLVVPFPTGAANDALARIIAAEMRESLGTVVIDNRPGGGGSVAGEYVKRSAPDGHTLLVVNDSYLILAAMNPNLPYDMLRDFDAIGQASNLPFFMVVNEEAVPVKSMKEFVDFAKARPGKLSFASSGNGAPHHLAGEMLKLRAGLDMLHVPYKGMGMALPDLVTGRVQFTITGLPAVASQLKGGKLRVLATVGRVRSALMPEVPTFAEAGVPNVEMNVWMGLVAPAGTPKPVLARLNAELNRVLKLPAVREKLAAQGIEAVGSTPEEFTARMRADLAGYQQLIKATGIRAE